MQTSRVELPEKMKQDIAIDRVTQVCLCCGLPIKMQVQKGTGFCSQNCKNLGPKPAKEERQFALGA